MRIAVSGIDGSGKTTVCRALVERLQAAGWPAYLHKLQPRAYQRGPLPQVIDPDDVRASSVLFNLAQLRDGDPGFAFTGETAPYLEFLLSLEEVLLFRRDAEAHDRPDSFVIHDRHVLDRRVNCARAGCPMPEVEAILSLIRPPDLTLLLDIPAELAEARLLAARGHVGPDEMLAEQAALRDEYLRAAANDSTVTIVRAGEPLNEVLHQTVLAAQAAFPALQGAQALR